ncbi:glycosyltransferase family 2 protein [Sphingobacterium paludis]|uniref:Glycosyl transferase family 2 n=1 Tax=Sphingobacterium paludis TaxID=1476465 RepID=A0A4R7D2H9_9SPHI|nr:glycosyltransferase [Sphingobacterium paludis]TDS13784.1 glycosyl transferase family 2 [Sphingobacterium paludis]
MSQPLVSIIVVSYNHARFITENLDSIKAQSYGNIELIVADDASQDNSIATFDKWLAENDVSAKKNYHKINTGLTTMVNECLKMAKGEYVKLIAADDFLHINYIERCVDSLIKTNMKAVITNAFAVDKESQIISDAYFDIPSYGSQSEMAEILMHYNFVPGSTLFLAKDVFEKVGHYAHDTILEDYNFALRMAKAELIIGVIRNSLIYYRRHENNLTVTKIERLQVERIKEQILFDESGSYSGIVSTNILREIVVGNSSLPLIRSLYQNYRGRDKRAMIGLRYPKLYRLLFRLKNKLSSK